MLKIKIKTLFTFNLKLSFEGLRSTQNEYIFVACQMSLTKSYVNLMFDIGVDFI